MIFIEVNGILLSDDAITTVRLRPMASEDRKCRGPMVSKGAQAYNAGLEPELKRGL